DPLHGLQEILHVAEGADAGARCLTVAGLRPATAAMVPTTARATSHWAITSGPLIASTCRINAVGRVPTRATSRPLNIPPVSGTPPTGVITPARFGIGA